MVRQNLEDIVVNEQQTMVNKFIVTSAEIGAKPNHAQLDSYERYAKENGAQIVVIPIEGQFQSEDSKLDPRFDNYTVASERVLGPNIAIRNFGIRSQVINPLTGLRRFGSVDKSIIVGSPKQHLEYVANSNKNKPKAVMSTGTCTLPNYKEHLRIGRIAQEDHLQGAIIVESDKHYFHFRQVQNSGDGSFVDLGRLYKPAGKSTQVRADTIVLGDLHEAQVDESAYEQSVDMIQTLKPKYIVLHDVFDAYSITHHDLGRHLVRSKKSLKGQLSLYEELKSLGARLDDIVKSSPNDTRIVVVKSNHDEHLDRYLDECRFVGDEQNMKLSVQLANAMIEGKDPIETGIKLTYGKLSPRIKFLQRDDDFSRYGWNLSSHGDKGPNGSKGSMNGFEYSLGKAIVGHSHSPCIRKNVYRMGTLERTDVDYTKGCTGAWSHTNAVIYNNGKTSLLNIFGGRWKK